MLELRPNCEHCDRALPVESSAAVICSFECTFCLDCAQLLDHICPNCGGNFCPRPIRPAQDFMNGNFLKNYPASTVRKYRPVDLSQHAKLIAAVKTREK